LLIYEVRQIFNLVIFRKEKVNIKIINSALC
jgi:hypothetical protein